MTLEYAVVGVLLTVGVLSVLLSAAGVVAAKSGWDKLHYTGPATVVAPVAIAAAVLVEDPLSSAGDQGRAGGCRAAAHRAGARARHRARRPDSRVRALRDPVRGAREQGAAIEVLQAVALLAVALCATCVVLARDPLRQAMVASIYGLALGILFFVF